MADHSPAHSLASPYHAVGLGVRVLSTPPAPLSIGGVDKSPTPQTEHLFV